jgi:putative ABC transport system substrate-binding protein
MVVCNYGKPSKRGEASVFDMRRRDFIKLIGFTTVLPLAARAQQGVGKPLVGFLSSASAASTLDVYRLGLEETGYVEGRNLVIEARWSAGRYESLPALAEELVKAGASVIIAGDLPATLAAKAATTTIPIVFIMGADPVALGIVPSLNRPGGNITGVGQDFGILGVKRLELLREVMPAPGLIALLSNPSNLNARDNLGAVLAGAQRIGQPMEAFTASSASEIDIAFAALVARGARGLLVLDDPFFRKQGNQLVGLADRHSIPAIYYQRGFVLAGGLVAYGPNLPDLYRLAGGYAGRILKGDKPSDLPVIQPTKFELVINLKTAKALGLTVPLTLLARADEVIE